MNRETQSLLMLMVGGAALRISVTDVYLRYVKAGLQPYLIAAAVMLLVIGAVTLWREIVERVRVDRAQAVGVPAVSVSRYDGRHRVDADRAAAPCEDPLTGQPYSEKQKRVDADRAAAPCEGSEHGHSGSWVAWLLVLPVFAIFLIAPPSLGSYAAARTGTSIVAPENSDYPPLPPGDPAPLTVLDYATRAVFTRDASLAGRTVKLSGFTSEREGGGVRLTRIILTCCAADGRPVKVTMVGKLPRKLAADTWVEVEGRYDPRTDSDPANGEKIPYLQVSSLRRIDKPANPYE